MADETEGSKKSHLWMVSEQKGPISPFSIACDLFLPGIVLKEEYRLPYFRMFRDKVPNWLTPLYGN